MARRWDSRAPGEFLQTGAATAAKRDNPVNPYKPVAPANFEDETLDGSTQLVAVSGELDLTNVGDLRRRVDSALSNGRPRIIIDLDGLTHLDSSGLAELITCHQRATELRGALVLVVTSPTIRRTLEIRGVQQFFTLAASRDGARDALS